MRAPFRVSEIVSLFFFFFSSRRRHTRLQGDWSSDVFFFFSSRRRHTRLQGDWSSDVCSSDLWARTLSICLRRSKEFSPTSTTTSRPQPPSSPRCSPGATSGCARPARRRRGKNLKLLFSPNENAFLHRQRRCTQNPLPSGRPKSSPSSSLGEGRTPK